MCLVLLFLVENFLLNVLLDLCVTGKMRQETRNVTTAFASVQNRWEEMVSFRMSFGCCEVSCKTRQRTTLNNILWTVIWFWIQGTILANIQDNSDYTCSCCYSRNGKTSTSRCMYWQKCSGSSAGLERFFTLNPRGNPDLILWNETFREPVFIVCGFVLFIALWKLEPMQELSLFFYSVFSRLARGLLESLNDPTLSFDLCFISCFWKRSDRWKHPVSVIQFSLS